MDLQNYLRFFSHNTDTEVLSWILAYEYKIDIHFGDEIDEIDVCEDIQEEGTENIDEESGNIAEEMQSAPHEHTEKEIIELRKEIHSLKMSLGDIANDLGTRFPTLNLASSIQQGIRDIEIEVDYIHNLIEEKKAQAYEKRDELKEIDSEIQMKKRESHALLKYKIMELKQAMELVKTKAMMCKSDKEKATAVQHMLNVIQSLHVQCDLNREKEYEQRDDEDEYEYENECESEGIERAYQEFFGYFKRRNNIHSLPSDIDSKIETLYWKTMSDSLRLKVNDWTFFKNFIEYLPPKDHSYLIEYLAMDALFHLRKEHPELTTDQTIHKLLELSDEQEIQTCSLNTSFRQFYYWLKNADSMTYDPNDRNAFDDYENDKSIDNLYRSFRTNKGQDFFYSVYGYLLGLERMDGEYQIPVFMNRFLLQLIDTIKFNPQVKEKGKASLKTFFLGGKNDRNFFLQVHSLYRDEGDRYIALYLAYQLFNTDTLIYLIEKLWNEKFLMDLDEILFYLLPIFFVPNFVGKYYCDIVVNILKDKETIETSFDSPSKSFAYFQNAPCFLQLQNQKANLTKCRQYLLFLSTVYYPVIRSCFYVRFRSAYPKPEDANEKLLEFLRQRNMEAIYDEKHKIVDKLSNKNTNKQLTCLTQMYGWIRDILSDKSQRDHWLSAMDLNYLSQDHVLRFVMGKKMEMNLEEDPFDSDLWEAPEEYRVSRENLRIANNPRYRMKYIEECQKSQAEED